VLPYESVVVTSGRSLLEGPPVVAGLLVDVAALEMMFPRAPMSTLGIGEVVTTVEPALLTLVMTWAATREEVVMVLPWALVVVIGISTLAET